MPGLILDGAELVVPGLAIVNYRDDPTLRLSEDDRRAPRHPDRWVRQIILHGTIGSMPKVLLPGMGPSGNARHVLDYWRTSTRRAGAHFVVDSDGTIYQTADVKRDVCYHASQLNETSVGVEMREARHGGGTAVWQATLDATVWLVDALTRLLGIQRQIPWGYLGAPIPRLVDAPHNMVGVFGHRDGTAKRGAGCPGDLIFAALRACHYEDHAFHRGADVVIWRMRQRVLRGEGHYDGAVDGIPGPKTTAALKASGRPSGMYVARPGDEAAP